MQGKLLETPGEFLDAVRPFLEEHPAANQLLLTNALRLPAAEPQSEVLLAAVFSSEGPILAATMAPLRPLVCWSCPYSRSDSTALEEAARALAGLLAIHVLPNVMGPKGAANALAAAYCDRRDTTSRLSEDLGVYQLTKVIPPKDVPGGLRTAAPGDIPSLVDLRDGFCASIQRPEAREKILQDIAGEVEAGILFLWEHEKPVSTAVLRRPIGKGIAIGGVYTPPELRRRGTHRPVWRH